MRTIIGVLIVLVGLQLLLTAAGVQNVPALGEWWPVILIAIGLMSYRSNPRMFFWPVIMVILGVVFLLANLEVLPGNAWDYIWPSIIILIGAHFLIGQKWSPRTSEGSGRRVFAAFSGRDEQVTGAFSKGGISAWFGGSKLDLRNATIADQTIIEVSATCGGIEILVPRNVKLVTRVSPIFGGVSDKTQPDAAASKTITIAGTVLFGGVEIKN